MFARSVSVASLLALVLALAATETAGQPAGLKVYFGTLHAHTSYSDGSGLPSEAYERARDVAKMDFYAITEHNHIGIDSKPVNYHGRKADGTIQDSALIPTAKRLTVDGTFVAIYGQEFSEIKLGNHVNVFDVSDVIEVAAGEFDDLLVWLNAHRDSSGSIALVQMNHPATKNSPNDKEYGRDDFADNATWRQKMDAVAETIAILNGPSHVTGDGHAPPKAMEKDYRHYLRLGFHIAPTADHDTHKKNWGTVTDTRTGVIAGSLTRASILGALRQRHAYATEDKNLRVIAEVNGHLCGDVITPPAVGSELAVSISIKDDDEPAAEYEIETWSGTIGGADAQMIERVSVTGDGVKTIADVHYEGGFQYFYFKVLQHGPEDEEHHDTDDAWTAPIWLEPGTAAPQPVAVNVSAIVASKNSNVYHVDPNCKYAKLIKPENRVFGSAAMVNRTRHNNCPAH